MKRSPLRRKTALRRVSKARKAQVDKYAKLKRSWREEHTFCEFPKSSFVCGKPAMAAPHHIKGRNGDLLCDTRYWMAICQEHHHWIHFVEPKLARKLGVLQF